MEEVITNNGRMGPGTGTVAQWLIEDAAKEQDRKVDPVKQEAMLRFCRDFDEMLAGHEVLDYAAELTDEATNLQFTVTIPGVFEGEGMR